MINSSTTASYARAIGRPISKKSIAQAGKSRRVSSIEAQAHVLRADNRKTSNACGKSHPRIEYAASSSPSCFSGPLPAWMIEAQNRDGSDLPYTRRALEETAKVAFETEKLHDAPALYDSLDSPFVQPQRKESLQVPRLHSTHNLCERAATRRISVGSPNHRMLIHKEQALKRNNADVAADADVFGAVSNFRCKNPTKDFVVGFNNVSVQSWADNIKEDKDASQTRESRSSHHRVDAPASLLDQRVAQTNSVMTQTDITLASRETCAICKLGCFPGIFP